MAPIWSRQLHAVQVALKCTILSSKLVEMDRSSLLIEVEEGLGRRSAVAEAILWAEQETEIVMFAISCLLLANYKSLQL
jgi:hypothetical protein